MRVLLARVVSAWRRLQVRLWERRSRSRMKWVRIRLETEIGEGVVFVRNPLVLAGGAPPGTQGSLTIRLGNRVRFAPGVTIEAEPGRNSVLEIGDGTRVGGTTHFHLRGGTVHIGAGSEIRDGCVLTTTDGDIEVGEHCFLGYGSTLDATELVVMEDRVVLGERVTLVDSSHETDGSDLDWALEGVPTAPVVVGADTVIHASAVVTMGSRIGANSQVGAGALVRGEHPDGVLLAGVPAEPVKWLGDL